MRIILVVHDRVCRETRFRRRSLRGGVVLHDAARNPDHGGARRHLLHHDRVGTDARAIANGAIEAERPLGDGRTEIRFREMPPISSYLVAFAVGPFDATDAVTTTDGVPVRIWLPAGLADKGMYARDAHRRAVEYLARYTAIPYPYGKIDAIGHSPIIVILLAIAADEARDARRHHLWAAEAWYAVAITGFVAVYYVAHAELFGTAII